jgi:hypothetical protein
MSGGVLWLSSGCLGCSYVWIVNEISEPVINQAVSCQYCGLVLNLNFGGVNLPYKHSEY